MTMTMMMMMIVVMMAIKMMTIMTTSVMTMMTMMTMITSDDARCTGMNLNRLTLMHQVAAERTAQDRSLE